jgi:hypothetical protein
MNDGQTKGRNEIERERGENENEDFRGININIVIIAAAITDAVHHPIFAQRTQCKGHLYRTNKLKNKMKPEIKFQINASGSGPA